jgi:hypothetical protein
MEMMNRVNRRVLSLGSDMRGRHTGSRDWLGKLLNN